MSPETAYHLLALVVAWITSFLIGMALFVISPEEG